MEINISKSSSYSGVYLAKINIERLFKRLIIVFENIFGTTLDNNFNSKNNTNIKKFNIMGILWTLIIGAIAGWLGSQIFKSGSLGLIGNIVVGIVGGFIGYWLLGGRLGEGVVGEILTGTIGAIVLLAVVNLFTRGKV